MPEADKSNNTVLVRRGSNIARGFPVKLLIPYIECKKLLGSDEISGDGVHWMRLDRHKVLSRYFSNPVQWVPEAPSPFSGEAPELPLEAEGGAAMKETEVPKPPGLDKQLASLAEMLRDLNR